MASAEERVERDLNIRHARSLGATIGDLAKEFDVSESRVKQILRRGEPLEAYRSRDAQRALAEVRREQLLGTFERIQQLADDIPVEQASAKIGAYKASLDALARLMKFEDTLGFLPGGVAYGPMPVGM